MKHVLVLGAGGFVGSRVVAALLQSGWAQPIAGLHRTRPPVTLAAPTVTVDTTDHASLTRALSGAEVVVNCVAGGSRAIADGAQCLFECTAKIKTIERVVHVSSIAVYGSTSGRVDETADLKADLGWYAEAKARAELSARAYARAGRRVVVLRPACIYGPGSEPWTGRIGRWLRAGRIGDLGASGDGLCNLVLIDDVVAAVIAALQEPGVDGEAINLGQPVSTWNGYFVRFALATGSTPVRRISRRRLLLETKVLAPALKVAEIAACRLSRRRPLFPEPIPSSLLRLWQQDIALDAHKAGRLLKVAWTPMERGLELAAQWFKAAHAG